MKNKAKASVHVVELTAATPIDTGALSAESQAVARALTEVLADTFTLYLKTHNFHWNVTGPLFHPLHLLFEQQYNELWVATDLLAERIRAIGRSVPATMADFRRLTSIHDAAANLPANAMVRQLLEGHESAMKTARSVYEPARAADDQVTIDLITQRLQAHDKMVWMLRATLN